MDSEAPLWWKVLNLDDRNFERSRAAGDSHDGNGKFRLKDLGLMRKLAPGLYESAAQEVKEYNDYVFENRGVLKKYKLGRKIGSIPIYDAALHPELINDEAARKKYWEQHPEMKSA